MSLTDKLKNNWFVLVLTVSATVAGVVWKVSDEVLVKPRDFEIADLQRLNADAGQKIAELQTKLDRLEKQLLLHPVVGEVEPKPCSEMPDWPKGKWWNWGRFENPPTVKNTDNWTRIPQVWPEVVFTSDQTYESETEQKTPYPTRRAYKAVAQNGDRMRPGAIIHFQGKDSTGYVMTETLTITSDGCLMHGTTTDSDGNFGPYHYLYQSQHYYATP